VFLRVLLVCNLCRTDAFLHFDMLVSSYFLQLNVMILITVFSSLIGALCLLKQGSFYYRYKESMVLWAHLLMSICLSKMMLWLMSSPWLER
jgi:hypothetical protein